MTDQTALPLVNATSVPAQAKIYGIGWTYLSDDERKFLTDLDGLHCPIWRDVPRDDGGGEFHRPRGWQRIEWKPYNRNLARLGGFEKGNCLCANLGSHLVVIDVDPRNGGDIDAVRQWLAVLSVRVFAEVRTPGNGWHLYVAGHREIRSVHGKLAGLPGVDVQGNGTNVFLPGTLRPKYDGKGYDIVFNDLQSLRELGDAQGAEALAQWVKEKLPLRTVELGQPWDGTPPDARQRAYLDKVLTMECKTVSGADWGTRNDTLNRAAFRLGQFVSGAGMDQATAEAGLLEAAHTCNLVGDDGFGPAVSTIESGLSSGMLSPRAVPGESPSVIGDDFWESTITLRHVRDFARARCVSPLAMLGVSLARVTAMVPPSVQLPPLVGDNASLNLFIGLVGPSGEGKGTAERAAKAAFRTGPIFTTGIGSGEGINHMFGFYDKDSRSTVMQRHSVLFSVPEIDSLAALGGRNGSTLLSQLRKAWSGEALTFGYADRSKALEIPEHAYRLSLVTGIQQGRAGTLLDDSDGGTPQRFVWIPVTDPDAPDDTPEAPEALDLTPMANGWPDGIYLIDLPPEVEQLVRANAKAKLRGQSTDPALDGHLMLCRIKVAAALALVHLERKVSLKMWELSGQVMAASRATRSGIEEHLAQQQARVNTARGKAEGARASAAESVKDEMACKRICQNVLRLLDQREPQNWSDLRRHIARRDRRLFDDAVDTLVAAGTVEILPNGKAKELKRTQSGR
jgi:hypothetical protein